MGLENQKSVKAKTRSKKTTRNSGSTEIKQKKAEHSRKFPLMATWEDDMELGFWERQ